MKSSAGRDQRPVADQAQHRLVVGCGGGAIRREGDLEWNKEAGANVSFGRRENMILQRTPSRGRDDGRTPAVTMKVERDVAEVEEERIPATDEACPAIVAQAFQASCGRVPSAWVGCQPVSYTHLTLPTIYSV